MGPKADYDILGCSLYSEEQLRDLVYDAMGALFLSPSKLSRIAGVSEHTIQRWLDGKQTIKYSSLDVIFAALHSYAIG